MPGTDFSTTCDQQPPRSLGLSGSVTAGEEFSSRRSELLVVDSWRRGRQRQGPLRPGSEEPHASVAYTPGHGPRVNDTTGTPDILQRACVNPKRRLNASVVPVLNAQRPFIHITCCRLSRNVPGGRRAVLADDVGQQGQRGRTSVSTVGTGALALGQPGVCSRYRLVTLIL